MILAGLCKEYFNEGLGSKNEEGNEFFAIFLMRRKLKMPISAFLLHIGT